MGRDGESAVPSPSDGRDIALARMMLLGEREEELRRRYPLVTDSPHFSERHTIGIAYTAMVCENNGWRQLVPTLQTVPEACTGLADVFRAIAGAETDDINGYAEAVQELHEAAAQAESGELQILHGGCLYRVIRVEQVIDMQPTGPRPPGADDNVFPEEFDSRR